MPALSVLDLAMFLLETPERPLNIGPLVVLAPPARSRAGFADRLVERMLKRPVGAPFDLRLHQPALGLPRLDTDAHVDAADHVHRLTLPAPGTLEQLFAKVCELHEGLLDRARPLWELHVIDGLEDGKVAVYGKVHHGIIDGRTFVKVVSGWLATSPRERTVRAMWEGVPRSARPAAARATLAARLRGSVGKASDTVATARAFAGLLAQQGMTSMGVGSAPGLGLPYLNVPRALKGEVSSARSFAHCTLELAAIKALGKHCGATVNDVILATLDIALASYLAEHGQRPDKPLVAAMPIALSGTGGSNQIAVLQFPLGGPGKGAAARLADILAQTAKTKRTVHDTSGEAVMLYTSLVHGLPALLEKAGMPGALPVSNFMVSNPFGLEEKRYLMGAEVELALPVSVVTPGQMLNITAVTLGERLQLGFLGIPSAVPELATLADHTVAAFAALQRAVDKRERASPARKRASAAVQPA